MQGSVGLRWPLLLQSTLKCFSHLKHTSFSLVSTFLCNRTPPIHLGRLIVWIKVVTRKYNLGNQRRAKMREIKNMQKCLILYQKGNFWGPACVWNSLQREFYDKISLKKDPPNTDGAECCIFLINFPNTLTVFFTMTLRMLNSWVLVL